MSLFSVLKRNARLALKGSWGKAMLILLISAAASIVLSILQAAATNLLVPPTDPADAMAYGINEYIFQALVATDPMEIIILCVFTLLTFLLTAPLSLGMIHWYRMLVQGQPAPVSEMFRYFENGVRYRRSIWFEINMSVRSLLWAVVFFLLPMGIYGASLYTLVTADESVQRAQIAMASVGLLISAILFLLCSVFYMAVVNRYLLASYLISEDDELPVWEALKTSVIYTRGFRFSLLWFQLSFILWFLLSALLFFLPLLYVTPFFNAALAMYARYIIEKNRIVSPVEATREFVVEERLPPIESAEEFTPEQAPPPSFNPFEEFRPAAEAPSPASEAEEDSERSSPFYGEENSKQLPPGEENGKQLPPGEEG